LAAAHADEPRAALALVTIVEVRVDRVAKVNQFLGVEVEICAAQLLHIYLVKLKLIKEEIWLRRNHPDKSKTS
jgi:hypothetical protein